MALLTDYTKDRLRYSPNEGNEDAPPSQASSASSSSPSSPSTLDDPETGSYGSTSRGFRDAKDKVSGFMGGVNKVNNLGLGLPMAVTAPVSYPTMAIAGIARTGLALGELAAKSFEEGWLGDVAGTRSREDERDVADSLGYSYSEVADAARADREGTSMAPSDRHGVSINPGLRDISRTLPSGKYNLGSEMSLGEQGSTGMKDQGGFQGLGIGNPGSYGGSNSLGNHAASEMGESDNDSGENDGSGGETGGDKDGGRY